MASACGTSATAPPAPSTALPPSVTLLNGKGFDVVLTPIGATIQAIRLPHCKDSSKQIDVALG
jgi:hypothetical protein